MYNAQYFIDKFTLIPNKRWTKRLYVRYIDENEIACCSMGHCMLLDKGTHGTISIQTIESKSLWRLVKTHLGLDIRDINDGLGKELYSQSSPKKRVLKALCDIQQLGG